MRKETSFEEFLKQRETEAGDRPRRNGMPWWVPALVAFIVGLAIGVAARPL